MKYLLLLFLSLVGFAQPLPLFGVRTAPTSAPLLLDLFPGASLAYSVRRLSTNYTGPLLQIQVIAGGITNNTDIGSVGVDLDQAACIFAVTNLGQHEAFVSKWYDQTGNGNNAYTTNAPGMPQIVQADSVYLYGTRPSMFNGQQGAFHFYLTTFVSGVQPWTMLALWQRSIVTGSSDYAMAFLAKQLGAPQVVTDGPGTRLTTAVLYTTTSANYSAYDTGTNLFAIMGVFVNASSEDVYFGSVQQTPLNNHNANAGSTNFEVLGFSDSMTQNGHHGSMQEVIFWNSDQSANRLAIFTNQNTYFQQYP